MIRFFIRIDYFSFYNYNYKYKKYLIYFTSFLLKYFLHFDRNLIFLDLK